MQGQVFIKVTADLPGARNSSALGVSPLVQAAPEIGVRLEGFHVQARHSGLWLLGDGQPAGDRAGPGFGAGGGTSAALSIACKRRGGRSRVAGVEPRPHSASRPRGRRARSPPERPGGSPLPTGRRGRGPGVGAARGRRRRPRRGPRCPSGAAGQTPSPTGRLVLHNLLRICQPDVTRLSSRE